MAETIEKKLRLVDLYAHYGRLLTSKQQDILDQYCMEDLSLAEISENLAISRQAVFDAVRKADRQLEELEDALGLLERGVRRKVLLDKALALMESAGEKAPGAADELADLRELMAEMLE